MESKEQLEEYLSLAESLARQAGEMIMAALTGEKRVMTKSSSVDVVTETDQACERLIIQGVRERYPSHRFIAEESHVDGGDPTYGWTDEPTWIIDPVDGTTNFVHAFPFTCVCVALAVRKEVLVSVVHNPVLRETYTAVRGGGARLNGEACLRPSATRDWNGALLCTEFGYEREPAGVDVLLGKLRKLLVEARIQGIRSLGSCALNMCAVASGRLDLYYEGVDLKQGPKPWDVAAASLILTEAGGVCRDTGGGPLDMCSGRILAANSPEMAQKLVDLFAAPAKL